jgi:hypothetical protein
LVPSPLPALRAGTLLLTINNTPVICEQVGLRSHPRHKLAVYATHANVWAMKVRIVWSVELDPHTLAVPTIARRAVAVLDDPKGLSKIHK